MRSFSRGTSELVRDPRDDGAILPLLAIAAVMIVIFLALAVDTARLGASKQQQKKTTQLSSMAALEAYREAVVDPAVFTTPAAQHAEKLRIAIDRAEQVAGFTKNSLLGRPGQSQVNAAADELGASHAAGQVVAGEYYFEEPTGGCTAYNAAGGKNGPDGCPCGAVGGWKAACFREADATENDARSFQVRLASKSDSPIANVFGGVFGQKNVSISSWGAAAMVPRHGIYAIDLSQSMAEETHLPPESLPGDKAMASYYTFRLESPTTCAGTDNPCISDGSGCHFATDRSYKPPLVWYGGVDPFGVRYAGMVANRSSMGTTLKTRHFRDDYKCFKLRLEDLDGNKDTFEEAYYLIDTHVHPYDNGGGDTGFYRGPEPLSSVLAGMQEALNTIQARSVAGDRIGVFGFDEWVQDIRVFPDTYPGQADYADLLKVTTVPDSTGGARDVSTDPNILKRIQKGYVPVPDRSTDTALAVVKASTLLGSMPNARNAQSYVAMFTDGLTTCSHSTGDYKNFIEKGPDGKPRLTEQFCRIPPDASSSYCDTSGEPYWSWGTGWDTLWNGLTQTSNLVSGSYPGVKPADSEWVPFMNLAGYQTYVEQKISFNVALFGSRTEPHTMLLKKGSKCVTDGQARSAGDAASYVGNFRKLEDEYGFHPDQSCYHRTAEGTAGCPFFIPQDWYYGNMVVPTGGFWVPIRPACNLTKINAQFGTAITPDQCKTSSVVQDTILDPACAAAASAPACTSSTAHCYRTPSGATEVNGGSGLLGKLLNAGVTNNYVGSVQTCSGRVATWDNPRRFGQHRLICDTNCRDMESQIRDFIRKLYATNPYVLVRSNGE